MFIVKALIAVVYTVIVGIIAGLFGQTVHNPTAAGWFFVIALLFSCLVAMARFRRRTDSAFGDN